MLELVEMDLRELLDAYEFPGDDTPIIAGSALMALNGEDDNELGTSAVKKLVETLDSYIPEPERAIDQLLKDRKSTRLNSSHVAISYAVFCLKKKNTQK